MKKTLSRKSLNSEQENKQQVDEEDNVFETEDNDRMVKNVILRRMQSNKKIYEKLRTKSHVYSDYLNENNSSMNSLFDYCLIVGIRDHQTSMSIDHLNQVNTLNKLNPVIHWKFPEQIPNLNDLIAEFCFPDPSCQSNSKKEGREIFQFTLTNLDGSRTYGNCIKLVNILL